MKKQSPFIGFSLALLLPALALAAQVPVTIANNSISPSTVNVNAGDTVVWSNTSSVAQYVTADQGSFQSGTISPGGQFAATFNTDGTYNYYDNAQGGAILGEVVVRGTAVTTPVTTSVQVPAPTTYVNPNASYQTVSAQNTAQAASLTTQVQSLIAEIDALEGTSGTGTGTGTTYTSSAPSSGGVGACPQIGRVLSLGSTGSDVSSLQQFLAASPSIYPQGLVTGYYGTLTEQAVENWQIQYHIISSGTPSSTGFGQVGPRTAAAMSIVCGGGTYNGVGSGSGSTGAGSGVVGGFLQVSPISGTAPLSVTVTATVNTAGDCAGATYTLDFGDGTADQQIPVAQGNCGQGNQVFQHTYQYGGTYTITLAADGHQSTATVTVSGPGAPQTGVSTPTQATGSISALVNSGNAPLSTTFYVSCASGLAYDVVFGDGSDLGASGVSQSSCTGALEAVPHTYNAPGTYSAQLVIFTQNSNGTVTPQTVATQNITAINAATANLPPTSAYPASYTPPTLVPDFSGNALEAQLEFSALSCGSPYTVNWGDSSAPQTPQLTCTSPNSAQMTTYSPTHTYPQTGNYTITLTRETNTGTNQTDTAAVAISE